MSLLILLVGLIGLKGMSDTTARLQTVYQDRTVPLEQLGKIARWHRASLQRLKLVNELYKQGPDGIARSQPELAMLRNGRNWIDEQWRDYRSTQMTDDENRLIAIYELHMPLFRQQVYDRVLAAPQGVALAADIQQQLYDEQSSEGAQVMHVIEQLCELQEKVAAQEFAAAEIHYRQARLIAIALIAAALLAGGGIALAIRRNLMRQLGCEPAELNRISRTIAAGDLRDPIHLRQGDRDSVLASVHHMQRTLHSLIGRMVDGVSHTSEAVSQMSSSASQIGSAVEQQTEAAGSMAAAVEEMLSAVSQIADSSNRGHEQCHATGQMAQQGAEQARHASQDMEKLRDSVQQSSRELAELNLHASRISGIVQVIKDIADQTNLLALNASIEAARAGEQGRGFAVVADEVRKLAERTNQSLGEVDAMISAIQAVGARAVDSMAEACEQARDGASLVAATGETIMRLEHSASVVVHTIGDISLSLKEQSEASRVLGGNVEGIAQMSEQNNLAVRQLIQALQSLSGMAENLRAQTSQFAL
ncbi:methyl-accepting chemotaxis protein [Chromobacterium sp. IIBBL 290-4]|nr:methyl-accepting chemotaxis protein [Chromobacterium sp. IIBBL 290-4]